MALCRFSSLQQPLNRIYKPRTSTAAYWISTLGTAGVGFFMKSIKVDSNLNVYIAGDHNLSGTQDIAVAKYNSLGVIQWHRSMRTAGFDVLGGIAVDSSGNVYICGNSNTTAGTGTEIIIAKFNTNGSDLWQRRLGNAAENIAGGITVDSSGSVYITGSVQSNSMTVAKYSTAGVIQWQRDLASVSVPSGSAIAVDSGGNSFVAGSLTQSGASAIICKYNASGILQWQNRLGFVNNTPQGVDIAIDSSGNAYLCGWFTNTANYTQDFFLAKYNTSGFLQWQRHLHGNNDLPTGITIDTNDNIYVLGFTDQGGNNDYIVARYNTNGVIQWQRRLGTSLLEYPAGITVDVVGDIYLSGYVTIGGTPTRRDCLFAKLPNNGDKTGTYSVGSLSVTYSTPSFTDSAGVLSDSPNIATDSAGALTDAASTLTVVDTLSSFTSTTILI